MYLHFPDAGHLGQVAVERSMGARARPEPTQDARLDESGNLAVSADLEAAGTSRPLSLTAKVSEASPDSATLTGSVDADRADFGMTWNQMGMVKGSATVSVTARFTRQA